MQTQRTDVLVIGGGAAGCRAALEARLAGAQVTLAVKGHFAAVGVRGAGASACGLDGSGAGLFATDVDSPPTAEQAYNENIQLGLGLSNPRLARILVEDSLRNRGELATLNVYPARFWRGREQPRRSACCGPGRPRAQSWCDDQGSADDAAPAARRWRVRRRHRRQ